MQVPIFCMSFGWEYRLNENAVNAKLRGASYAVT